MAEGKNNNNNKKGMAEGILFNSVSWSFAVSPIGIYNTYNSKKL